MQTHVCTPDETWLIYMWLIHISMDQERTWFWDSIQGSIIHKGLIHHITFELCHVWMSHVTYEWVVSRMNESHMNDSYNVWWGLRHHSSYSFIHVITHHTHSYILLLIILMHTYYYSSYSFIHVITHHIWFWDSMKDSFIHVITHHTLYEWFLCDSFMRDTTHSYVTWLIHTWHDSFICDSFMLDTTHSYVTWLIHTWHDLFICDSFMRDMTRWYVTWLIHKWRIYMCHESFIRDMTHLHVTHLHVTMAHLYLAGPIHMWHNSFICDAFIRVMSRSYGTWLIYMWLIYTWRGPFICSRAHSYRSEADANVILSPYHIRIGHMWMSHVTYELGLTCANPILRLHMGHEAIMWRHRCPLCMLQRTATHCNTLPHTPTIDTMGSWSGAVDAPCARCTWLQLTATHTATHCNTLQLTATHCSTLQHTLSTDTMRPFSGAVDAPCAHCNSLQHTVAHSNHRHRNTLWRPCAVD